MSSPEAPAGGRVVTIVLGSARATEALGARLARALTPPAVVLLDGDLGAGKTTLTRGFVRALPGGDAVLVQSPTFALARTYPTTPVVHHLDLYRLDDDGALDALGLRDLLDDPVAVSLVEWPRALPAGDRTVRVHLDNPDEQGRTATIVLPAAFAHAKIEARTRRAR